MVNRLGAALAALAVVFITPAFAQDKGDQPAKSDAERLAELEKKVTEQQKEIDALEKAKNKPIDEKGPLDKAPEGGDKEDKKEIGYKDGFFIKGKLFGSDYEIRPRARIQLDYRAYPHAAVNDLLNQPIQQDHFLIRRARVGFGGRFNDFTFELDVDPTRNVPNGLPLGDFWFQWNVADEFKVRFGHYKAPWDLEDFVTSDLYLNCVERPMIIGSGNQLAPDFNLGVGVTGQFNKMLTYWLAVMDMADSNTANIPQGNNGSTTAAKQTASATAGFSNGTGPAVGSNPMVTSRIELNASGFWVGGGAIFANRSGIQNSFSMTTPGQFTWFSGVFVRGWEQRYEADVAVYNGPFFAQAVYAYASEERFRTLDDHTSATGLNYQGTSFTLGFMVAGPPKDHPHPMSAPFKDWQVFNMDTEYKKNSRNVGVALITRFEWAAVEESRGGRLGQTTTQAQPSTKPDADVLRGNQCKAMTIGLNIFPIENVKFMFDYVYLWIGDQARSEKPHDRFCNEVLVRCQLEF